MHLPHGRFFRGIHLPHRSCPTQARYISDSSALRCDTPNQVFENCGRNRVRTCGLSPVSIGLLAGSHDRFRWDLRKPVRQGSRKSASIRGDCHSVSHSAVILRGSASLGS
jgi:hypothetical protein